VWNPVEVTKHLQHLTNIIVEGAVKDSPELAIAANTQSGSASLPGSPSSGALPPAAPNIASSGKSASKTKQLHIEDRTYYMVSATSEILPLLLDYLRIIVNMSMLTTDTMSRVIEFLKAFNSRTCQVVLGAGAMRSAGLKNITAKHLGSSQISVVHVNSLLTMF